MIATDERVPESHVELNVAMYPWLMGEQALTLIVPPSLREPIIILDHSTINTAKMLKQKCTVLNGQTLVGAYSPQENFRGRGLVIELHGKDPGPVFAPIAIMVEVDKFKAMRLEVSGWEFEHFWRVRTEGVAISIPTELNQAMGFGIPAPGIVRPGRGFKFWRRAVKWLEG